MDGRIGIGIITHNRKDLLAETIRRCDVVILLEDDTQPSEPGWEQDWIAAARRWGHINFAAPGLRETFETGRGMVEYPFLGPMVTAQCAAYARAALDCGGYFDTRFTGYGHEHMEHSRRLLRMGYGGTETVEAGVETSHYAALAGGLIVRDSTSHFDAAQVERNLHIAHQAMADVSHRVPWRSVAEMRQFRAEITAATDAWPGGFALRRDAAEPVDGTAMDFLRGRVSAPPPPPAPTSSAPTSSAPTSSAPGPARAWRGLWSWLLRR